MQVKSEDWEQVGTGPKGKGAGTILLSMLVGADKLGV